MASTRDPDLAQYMNKRLSLRLNGSRKVVGVLKGYDFFLNVVLENAYDETDASNPTLIGTAVIRGVSVVSLEALQ